MSEKKILSQDEVRKVAQLARIELTQEEEEKFADELSSILEHFKDLSSVMITEAQKFDHYKIAENQFREDKIKEESEEDKEKIRQLFPQRESNALKVKTVLNGK